MNKQVVEGVFHAINERRYADWADYMAADVVDHNSSARARWNRSS